MAGRRDLTTAEMAIVAELALATPDLVAARARLLAAARGEAVMAAVPGRRQGQPTIEPKSLRELMEAVRLGVLTPQQARRFIAVPQAAPGTLARLARVRWQRGGIVSGRGA